MRKVIISKTALKDTAAIADYIEAKFSIKFRIEFIDKLKKGFELIQNNPESFLKSEVNIEYRRFVLTKQTTIYYKYNKTEIRILALFDTRRNPSKINKIK